MNEMLKKITMVAALIVMLSCVAVAQTTTSGFTYAFPTVTAPGLQMVLSNVGTSNAAIQVTFYSEGGGVTQFMQFSLAAGTQTTIDDSRVSLGSFIGGAIVQSSAPLVANVTTNNGTTLDSAVPAVSSTADLIIPFARSGVNGDTRIGLFNPGAQTANVVMILGEANGTMVTGSQIAIGAKQSQHIPLSSIALGFADLNAVNYVIVRAIGSVLSGTRQIVAEGDVTQFVTPSGTVAQDGAVVAAAASENLTSTALIPLFVQGFGYYTQLEVVNSSTASETVTLTARGTDGSVIPTGTNPVSVTLPAHGAFSNDVASAFNLSADAMGSISISGSGSFAATGMLGSLQAPGLMAIAPAGPPVSLAALQYRSITTSGYFSGLSFLNQNSQDAGVSLTFITSDGFTISNAQITVPAGTQLVDMLSDLMPEAEGAGFLYLSSSPPIEVAGIEGSSDASMLSPLAVTPITTGFIPQSQQRFLAVGTATVAGQPIPGATVVLTGPISGDQITDSTGAFVFRDIPPGTYTVSIQLAGITFSPSSTTFTITSENMRNINFNGTIVGSTLTSVSPSSVLVGAASFVLTAKGGPFIPTSQIVFDGTALATTFVDQATLTAVVPAASLRFSRVTSVQVQNQVGTNVAPSQPLPFVIGNPAPVVTGVSGIPSQIIAGYPGFTVTLMGTGFNSGGTIEFAGVPRPYVFDSPSQVHAFIGPADLAVGQVANLTATNPSPSVGPSNATQVTVYNPVAGLLSISPSTTTIKIEVNSTGLQMVINGFLFKPGATVQVAGFPALTTTYVNSTQLMASIPPTALQVGGSFPVTVTNPAPNLGSSEVQPLIVDNLVPQLASIDTGPLTFTPGITADTTVPVNFVAVLHGSNFGKEYNAVMIAPSDPFPSCAEADPIPLSPQVISSTEMVVTLQVKCTGNYSVYAGSPQSEPGGGTSALIPFTVNSPTAGPVPTLAGLVPNAVPAGTTFELTINGSNFQAGALVNFGTAILTPDSISASTITVKVPSYYVPISGIIPVTVTNPGTGGTSTRLLFLVN